MRARSQFIAVILSPLHTNRTYFMLYVNDPFDRADHLRKQQKEVDTLWSQRSSKLVPYCAGQFWIADQLTTEQNYKSIVTINTQEYTDDFSQRLFLGLHKQQAWFAMDFTEQPEQLADLLPERAQQASLRSIGTLLNAQDAAILAYAQALLHWHQHSRFCQICGHPNTLRNSGHVRICTNADCQRETFPRTDAAVIMLVVDNSTGTSERVLLGRNAQWPSGVYSTLAGFVEPGETLEGAVRREVLEETNIHVGTVQYQASQPWPFPQSMMLGFRAWATSFDITVNPDELEDAAWFSREELETFGNWGDENFALQLPRPDSISRYLINSWLNE